MAKCLGTFPPVGVLARRVSRPLRASTENTAMLSCPRFDT
jgi:hypothetical protein